MRESVSRQVKALSGLDLTVEGGTTVAFLPVPRVKFRDISLSTPDGVKLVEGGQLRGEVRLLPLLAARIELTDVSLNGARILVSRDADGRSPWDATLERLKSLVLGPAADLPVRRVAITGSRLDIHDARLASTTALSDADMILAWPLSTGPLTASGSFVWKGEPVGVSLSEVMPAALLAGQPSRLTLSAKGSGGSLSVTGTARFEPDLQFTGQTALTTGSLRSFARWSGLPLPLAGLVNAFALEGEVTANAGQVSWPNARLTVGRDRLDGSLAILRESGRPLLRATLAGNQIDLSDLVAPFAAIRTGTGSWTDEPFSPGMASAGNVDLRLSAASAQIGRVRLEDVAAALLQTENRLEVSLGRAGLERGTVKGRLALGIGSGFFDLKAQGAFDRVDVGAVLAQTGQKGWISGIGQGQFAVEAFGESPADLIRQVSGRANLTVRQGEITGISFEDMLRRVERRSPFDWRGGRTPFDQAQVGIQISNGVAEITDGTLNAATARSTLQGSLSLPDRLMAVRVTTEGVSSASPPSSMVFDVGGPWSDLSVTQSSDMPVRRSDAARSLIAR